MAEHLSTEITNRVVEGSSPCAGSPSFTLGVRRRGLPDFLSSVNLKYVKLGYSYLLSHGFFYFLAAPPLFLVLIFGAEISKVSPFAWRDLRFGYCDAANTLYLLIILFTAFLYLRRSTPNPTYLLDFACYRPPDDLKVSKAKFMELVKESGHFDDASKEFQERVLKKSGIGDETYLPPSLVWRPPDHKRNLKDGREEAEMVTLGAIDDLLAATKVHPRDIGILIVNCGLFNPTPSLAAMLVNRYKMRSNIQSFNLGGMGCAAGIVAVDLARDLLATYSRTYALVVSFEAVSSTWYTGKEREMLLPNCIFRMGAAAVLLSNRWTDRWQAKYQLRDVVRTQKGMEKGGLDSIQLKEDGEGNQGLWIGREAMEVGGEALKANLTTLAPLVLPITEQFRFLFSIRNNNTTHNSRSNNVNKKAHVMMNGRIYIPDYKRAFEHICVQASSKKVLDEVGKNLELSEDYMEASRKTLDRFGNTSSSSVWYQLAYLEAHGKVKRGHRLCQLAFGSGFKCSTAVWRALRNVPKPHKSPWFPN